MKRVFMIPIAVLALAGVATGAYFWVTAQGTAEEAPPPQQEATPTPTPEPTSTPEFTPTTTPSLLPQPSPQPIPDDWLTYTDPEIGVSLRYPPDWNAEKRTFPVHPEFPPGETGGYRLDIYSTVPNPAPEQKSPAWSAKVSLYSCCVRGFLEWWACDHPTEQVAVGGYDAELCVYVQSENPHPQSGMVPPEGAYMFYTVHAPQGEVYVGITLYTLDETGTALLDTWNAVDEVTAKQVVQSLQTAP